MIAVMSEAGVTSNAGLNTGDSAGAVCWAPTPRTSAGSRSSIGMCSPEASVGADRESTRLNSSHSQISDAVFCLEKKKKAVSDIWLSIDETQQRALVVAYNHF